MVIPVHQPSFDAIPDFFCNILKLKITLVQVQTVFNHIACKTNIRQAIIIDITDSYPPPL
jgi:hypothetical protein